MNDKHSRPVAVDLSGQAEWEGCTPVLTNETSLTNRTRCGLNCSDITPGSGEEMVPEDAAELQKATHAGVWTALQREVKQIPAELELSVR